LACDKKFRFRRHFFGFLTNLSYDFQNLELDSFVKYNAIPNLRKRIAGIYLHKMLYLLAVLALIAAAALLVRYSKRQSIQPLNSNSFNSLPSGNLRPLFEPTEDELREVEQEKRELEKAEEKKRIEAARDDREREIRRLLSAWRSSPNRQNTADLLKAAADMGEADLFSEVSTEIIKVFSEHGVGGLSPGELAALIDSHCRLLPQAERSSGALFWLKEEIAGLCS
jgi:hypothetical protein